MIQTNLEGKRIVLGVTGSIAAYKAVDLASRLVQLGAVVDTVMTSSAMRFLSPLMFSAITHRETISDLYKPKSNLHMDHLSLAREADLILVAPVTANIVAKLAHGIADDALTTTILATASPVLLAPAGDGNMFENPATVKNLKTVHSNGMVVIGPERGHLASGLNAKGRLVDPKVLVGHIRKILGADGDYSGRKVVVSAGGTREPIDPVRVITNRSSGKMGYALAEAARDRGARVSLITTTTSLTEPPCVDIKLVETAHEMRDAVIPICVDADLLIMAAAIGDFRTSEIAREKIKKESNRHFTLKLVPNADWMMDVVGDKLVKIAFAAETKDLIENATKKLVSKNATLVIANDVSEPGSGFGSDTNRVTIIDRDGNIQELPNMEKFDVANAILNRALKHLN